MGKKMHQKIGTILLSGFLLLFDFMDINAQQIQEVEELVKWSPEGMVVFVSDAALSQEMPQKGMVEGVVYRRMPGESNFEEIARLKRASSWDEFVERGGKILVKTLMEESESSSEEELWHYIQQNPQLENYGFLNLDSQLWKAFGTAFFDSESKELLEGERVEYEVRYVTEDGNEADIRVRGTGIVGEMPNLLKPELISRTERDSLVGGVWASQLEGAEDAAFGRVYRQVYPDGDFELLPDVTMASPTADGYVVYEWKESVIPEQSYRYYIEPVDILGNTGPPSDTLMVISVDFNNLPLMENAVAKDTTSGIHLSWDPVPNKPYISGIEIQRSRQADQGFVTLDTLNVSATEYLDTQLVPNQPYHYRFRIVSIRDTDDIPSATASAAFRNEDMPPSAPYGLRAEQEGEGIRLHWDPVAEHDLFGYYVYRGTSRQDSMAVISRAIKDTTTFFDNSPQLHGRTNYVYAVKAVNMSELVSDFSNRVAIRPNRIVRPPAPVGIEGYAEQKRVRLFWDDQKRRDKSVAGYHLYRSRSSMEISPDSAAAAIQAEQVGFERITENLISSSAFDDNNVETGETYYYAVSSVDVFGEESVLSNTARFIAELPDLRPPSRVNVRTISEGVEINWNTTRQENAEAFQLFRRERGSDKPELVITLQNETTYIDRDVSEGDFYWYSVSVTADERQSPRSREQPIRFRH